MQVKLLRVLHRSSRRSFERLGGEVPIHTDVRGLAATNKDLRREVEAGRFREDLYYRISALIIRVPPLRDHPGDVPLLTRHFLAQLSASGVVEEGVMLPVDEEAQAELAEYPWPGNVRQLESVLLRALVLFGEPGQIAAEDVRRALAVEEEHHGRHPPSRKRGRSGSNGADPGGKLSCPSPAPDGWFWERVREPWKARRPTRGQVRELIERTLEETGGFYTRAARRLGVARDDYQRFVDFLANNDLQVDWRPYREGS